MKVEVNRRHVFAGHRDPVYTLQGGGGPYFFSGAGDGMVVKWNLETPGDGELIARLPNSIYALHLIQSGDLLVAGHNYDGIHVLDWKNKKEISSLQFTAAAIFDLQSRGDIIWAACGDGSLFKIDLRNMQIIGSVFSSEKSARSIALDPLSGDVAVGYSDHHIRIFDEHLKLKREWKAHQNSVFTLQYTEDGKLLVSGSRDARLKAWSAIQGYALAEEVVAHMYAINHVAFSPDGKHFVTCSMDKSIKVWDAHAFKLLKVIDRARHAGHATSVNKLLWAPYNGQLLSASDDRSISLWQIIF